MTGERRESHDETRRRYLESLPAKRMSAAGLLFDLSDRILLVKPSYNEVWHLPGGVVEALESPLSAVRREVFEETGLSREPNRLLSVDYKSGEHRYEETLVFIFDYGRLDDRESGGIRIDHHEIVDFLFADSDMAAGLVSESMAIRMESSLLARRNNSTYYLENGRISVN